jgi:integrase
MKTKLTKRLVESLKPGAKLITIRDSELTGFMLRMSPSGAASWLFDYRNKDGRRLTYKVGRYPGLEPEGARRQAKEIAGKVAAGIDPQAEKQAARVEAERARTATLEGFLKDRYEGWALTHIRCGEQHIAAIRANFKRWLDEPLASLNSWRLESWRRDQLKAGAKPATCNRNLSRLRSLLNKAVEWDVLGANPMKGLKQLRVDNKRLRFLSPAEEGRLLDALLTRETKHREARERFNQWRLERHKLPFPAHTAEFVDHIRPLTLLALNTGLRRGELLKLRWRDLDEARNLLTVAVSSAKSGHARHIPLNTVAAGVLRSWKKQVKPRTDDAFVFANDDGARIASLKRSWATLCKIADIPNFKFHDTRHHFASRLVQASVPLNTVRELLGHASLTMTLRYAHLAPGDLAAAVAKLA